ncbi:hypothetical protein PaG_03969 [Moesziomyces aphidis]|uniref:PCI domain-containing protein n=1 Tax=Moesziomyces aphidis TaxID=84754 RepID=W3VM44_MOEAP|nr:hypothetical protein PaG_03969 [Moesziomyces aphidis]
MTAVASSSTTAASAAAPSSSASRLEPLLLVARSTKPRGAAAAKLIHQAISTPGAYFFSELFDIPGVAELITSATESDGQLRAASYLLQLFAYGTYDDYLQLLRAEAIEAVSAEEVQKLRQLTLLSLARNSKSLAYGDMHAALGIAHTRELEDLIIESVYAGLITGRLDQVQSRFEVHHVQGRHVAPPTHTVLPSLSGNEASLQHIFSALQTWQATTASVLSSLQSRMDAVRSTAAQAETARTEHHQALLQNLTNAQHQLEAQQKKSKPNAMDLDEDSRTDARKKSTSSAARGNKRSRA